MNKFAIGALTVSVIAGGLLLRQKQREGKPDSSIGASSASTSMHTRTSPSDQKPEASSRDSVPPPGIPNRQFLDMQEQLGDFAHHYGNALAKGDYSGAGALLHFKLVTGINQGREPEDWREELDERVGAQPEILRDLELARLYFSTQGPGDETRNQQIRGRFRQYQDGEFEDHRPCYGALELVMLDVDNMAALLDAAEQCYGLPKSEELRDLQLSITGDIFAGQLAKNWGKRRADEVYREFEERFEMPLTAAQIFGAGNDGENR